MSIKNISDSDLLKGVEQFEEALEKLPQFRGIKFIQWDELDELKFILNAKISKGIKKKIIKIDGRHTDALYHFPLSLDDKKYNDRESLKQAREELMQSTLDQIKDLD